MMFPMQINLKTSSSKNLQRMYCCIDKLTKFANEHRIKTICCIVVVALSMLEKYV